MAIEHIRLSARQARDQLITLKRRTGIAALECSVPVGAVPLAGRACAAAGVKLTLDSNVEMNWRTFGGDLGDVLWALLRLRCHNDGLPLDEETLAHSSGCICIGESATSLAIPRHAMWRVFASVGLSESPAA